MIAKIHIARKDLGLDEDDYRAVLHGAVGCESCKAMTDAQLNAVLERMRELGWKPKSKGKSGKKLSPKTRHKPEILKTQIDKIRAEWIEAAKEGAVRSRYEDALNAFVKRMTGIERVDWLRSAYDCNKVIEGIKAMRDRNEAGKVGKRENRKRAD